MHRKPQPIMQTTTLWDFPSQHYGEGMQGDRHYRGATPSYVIWNLLKRFTNPGDTVLDPMCGSGTTLDVAADLGRKGLGFDLGPVRKDIGLADARHLPVAADSVDFAFVDPPYGTHLKYTGRPECIGELDVDGGYYEAMAEVFAELYRVLKPGGHLGVYVSDSWRADKPFAPIGFELFQRLLAHFSPVDIVAVVRRNRALSQGKGLRQAAPLGVNLQRGFNYLLIVSKASTLPRPPTARRAPPKPLKPINVIPRGKKLRRKKGSRL